MDLYTAKNLINRRKFDVSNYADYKCHEIELINSNNTFDISFEHNKLKDLIFKHTKGLYNIITIRKHKVVQNLWFAKFNIQTEDGYEIYSINLDTNDKSETFYIRPLDFFIVDDSEKVLKHFAECTYDTIICKFFHQ